MSNSTYFSPKPQTLTPKHPNRGSNSVLKFALFCRIWFLLDPYQISVKSDEKQQSYRNLRETRRI